VAGWALVAYCTMQMTRFMVTLIWLPSPDLMHPDAVQAFFSFVNCIMGLSSCLAVLWLALCSQRHDLQTLAFTDALTGLMNRRGFDEIIEREMRSHRRGEPPVLLLIDIDSFKAINDDYGHQAGDEVIRQVGRVLEANSRAGDTVSRYGGEEFVMLLRDLRLDRAEVIAERLRAQIAGIRGLPEAIGVTVSIGLAVHAPGDTSASLLKSSDDALYFAKRSGRNRVSVELA
jgi:diguanylate cyclase (GGDEF)-like protein